MQRTDESADQGPPILCNAVASASTTPLWLAGSWSAVASVSATPLWIYLTRKITESLFPGSADIHVRNERAALKVVDRSFGH